MFMNQKLNLFSINSYNVFNNEIIVNTERYSIIIPVTIPLDKFELWLRTTDKLQWVIHTKCNTEHFIGTMSSSEYWQTQESYIKEDIYNYIISNPITREGVVYTNSLGSLLLAFDLHNAQRISPVFNTRWEHEQDVPEFINLIN